MEWVWILMLSLAGQVMLWEKKRDLIVPWWHYLHHAAAWSQGSSHKLFWRVHNTLEVCLSHQEDENENADLLWLQGFCRCFLKHFQKLYMDLQMMTLKCKGGHLYSVTNPVSGRSIGHAVCLQGYTLNLYWIPMVNELRQHTLASWEHTVFFHSCHLTEN